MSALWGRVFASLYDPFLWWGERRGLAQRRHELLAQAKGRVLEIGAGTGLNLEYYRADVRELVLADPEPPMVERLERRLRESGRAGRVVKAGAERLQFEDRSFDSVVSTLVLCTVDDPAAALREIRRVLAPGGCLLFIEHVRAAGGSRLARWQDRLEAPWRAFAYGCRCNRDTLALLAREGFAVSGLERAEWRGMVPIARPLVIGRAEARRA
jgi:ubiquinone/menaquinone biosynthesis C-methylase UbiE